MQLKNEKKIFFDYKMASSHQISITFGSLDHVQIWVEDNNKELLEHDKSSVDEGWTLMTSQRLKKMSLQKESSEQPTRRRMVKKLIK